MNAFPLTATATAFLLGSLIVAGVLIKLYWHRETPRGVLWWGGAIVAYALARFLPIQLSSLSEDAALALGTGLYVLSGLLLFAGARNFLHRRMPWLPAIAVCCLTFGLGVALGRLDALWPLPALPAAVLTAAALTYVSLGLLAARPSRWNSDYLLAVMAFLGLALLRLAEPWTKLRAVDDNVTHLLVDSSLTLAATMGLVLIVLRRLRVRLEQSEATIREQYAQLRGIVDAMPDPMLISSVEDGRLLYANMPALSKLSLETSDLGERTLDGFFADGDQHMELMLDLRDDRHVDSAEARMRTRRGKPFWALVSLCPMRFQDQNAVLTAFKDISRQKQLEEQLVRLATVDSLTGAFSRRHFMELATKEIKRSKRYHHAASLLLLDIDHFKRVNDTYGHSRGDHVLRLVAAHCRGMLRAPDFVGRLGGEEFAIMLPQTGLDSATEIAERLRISLSQQDVSIEQDSLHVTVSIGVAECLPDDNIDECLRRADLAMYEAKRKGRNRVETYGGHMWLNQLA